MARAICRPPPALVALADGGAGEGGEKGEEGSLLGVGGWGVSRKGCRTAREVAERWPVFGVYFGGG